MVFHFTVKRLVKSSYLHTTGEALKERELFFFPEVLESTGSDYVSAIMEQIMVVNGMGWNRIIGFSQSQSTP